MQAPANLGSDPPIAHELPTVDALVDGYGERVENKEKELEVCLADADIDTTPLPERVRIDPAY